MIGQTDAQTYGNVELKIRPGLRGIARHSRFRLDALRCSLNSPDTMTHDDWICPKCENEHFETAELRASGGGISSMFDIENQQFTTVTCTRCHYTELYRTDANSIQQVLDFLTT